MATQELYLRGDQIGTYRSLSSSGNGNGIQVTLSNVVPLGAADSYFRVVVRQVTPGQDVFNNGQFVDIYAWPDTNPPSPPLYSNLNPQHDQFQGRASSAGHEIFTNPANIVFQTNPITAGTIQYGPGFNPPRAEQLPFNSYPSTPPTVPCLVEGTLILTAHGEIPVEHLRAGDRVQTLDNGLQPIVWAGHRKVCALGSMAPIRFEAGTVGNRRKLLVSPQHRMLVAGAAAQLVFGDAEAFAAAAHLLTGRAVRRVYRPRVRYVHLLCEDHQVILAEGAPTESLFPGATALSAFDAKARSEITRLFPDLCAQRGTGRGIARAVLPRSAARLLVA